MIEIELQRIAQQQLDALKRTLDLLDQVRQPARPRRPRLRVVRGTRNVG
jgi:hypothetical protein